MSDGMGGSIPFACQDWANTKAAYRFFSNPRVEEGDILNGHFAATSGRFEQSDGPILVLQDTTEFSYQRRDPHAVGFTNSVNSGRDKDGRLRHHAVCGILMHSSLAVTQEGLPLGLAAVKFWSREKFKGTAQLKRKINPTRVPIEGKESVRWPDNLRQSIDLLGRPDRCIHVGDRESDIYELYCLTKVLGTTSSCVQSSIAWPATETTPSLWKCGRYKAQGSIRSKCVAMTTRSRALPWRSGSNGSAYCRR